MLISREHTQCKKELKNAKKRGNNSNRLIAIINRLQERNLLSPQHKSHTLTGN